ncbi:acyl-CoA synthetase (AMP-forming)/AMP-acid ligase II [Shewanella psychrophila]|uniref:Acyl-CoA synthetase (AMP-forming)/AMP-acid ligase II n=1 Tax=Shewanella psychrophila TaxID=225848 RepID=A0A1S6HNP5_9GAMM|nr:fatty acid CoA ligase family protein [Shewanella psychrophila]AQS37135.1 acyl-CoA synthetase (AMP-forming)/AMP-acid ligase II [Shewanella psychrophila]
MSASLTANHSSTEQDSEIHTRAGVNLCRHLISAAKNNPDDLAVAVQTATGSMFSTKTLEYQELNFSELNQQSDRLAHGLNAYGITRGMKAVLMVTPSVDFFTLTFALFKAGVVPILVDPGMGVKNLKQCFIESEPDAFIGIPKAHLARKLFGWGKGSVQKLVTVGGRSLFGGVTLEDIAVHGSSEPYDMIWLDADEMAAILFTSGSTGTPKGVIYSHKMFEAQISALRDDYKIKPGERDLATFPLFSLFGPALGMASIIPEMDASKPITANPDYLFAAIEKYQCSNMFVNPALIERLGQAGVPVGAGAVDEASQHKLPSIKRVISAGAPATISSIKHFSKMLSDGVEVLNSYGATESLPLSKMASQALFGTTAITDGGGGICVGDAISGVDITIIAITEKPIGIWSDDLKLQAGQIGEIVVKGPMVSRSYYRRDSATEQAKIQDGEHTRHRMGDLGYLDSEGKLWMCGRKAHRVDASSGKRYFSIPVERIFNTHPQVKRSALVGVEVNGQSEIPEIVPLLCIELDKSLACSLGAGLYAELNAIAEQHKQTLEIKRFLIHPEFPVDIRHNAKIFREKLAVWAQNKHKE